MNTIFSKINIGIGISRYEKNYFGILLVWADKKKETFLVALCNNSFFQEWGPSTH